jgi:hypothetical protein
LAAVFTRGIDSLVRKIAVGVLLSAALFISGFYYYAYPQYTRVGYQPEQPVAFSHQLHVGQLGMDCRYCHQQVENSKNATLPNTQVCMSCHNGVDPGKANIKGNSPLLSQVRESWKSGNPVPWKRIHKVPEFAYFDHSIHVNRGVSCFECHGPINEMKTVWHDQSLTMGWCLDCHHNPETHLRPKQAVYDPLWKPQGTQTKQMTGEELRKQLGQNPPSHCGGCHR